MKVKLCLKCVNIANLTCCESVGKSCVILENFAGSSMYIKHNNNDGLIDFSLIYIASCESSKHETKGIIANVTSP